MNHQNDKRKKKKEKRGGLITKQLSWQAKDSGTCDTKERAAITIRAWFNG